MDGLMYFTRQHFFKDAILTDCGGKSLYIIILPRDAILTDCSLFHITSLGAKKLTTCKGTVSGEKSCKDDILLTVGFNLRTERAIHAPKVLQGRHLNNPAMCRPCGWGVM